MPKSTASSNSILALIYNATPWANIADNAASSPTTLIFLSLATASYGVSSTMSSNEATGYTNYVRQSTPRSTSGWTAPASGSISNVAAVEYPQCGVTGATITSCAAGKATGASEVFHYGDLNAPLAVSNLIQPRFPIGAITISEA